MRSGRADQELAAQGGEAGLGRDRSWPASRWWSLAVSCGPTSRQRFAPASDTTRCSSTTPSGSSGSPLPVSPAVVAAYVGVAALETAAAMRVLSPDRPLPSAQPQRPAGRRRGGVGALAVVSLMSTPEWPASGVAGRPRARCRPCGAPCCSPPTTRSSSSARRCAPCRSRPGHRTGCSSSPTTARTPPSRSPRDHGVDVVETVGNHGEEGGRAEPAAAAPAARPPTSATSSSSWMPTPRSAPEFLEDGLRRLEEDPALMAVGGLFHGEPGYGLIGQFQRNEYARYQRLVARKSGRVFVLTGTASLIRAVRAVRRGAGPRRPRPRASAETSTTPAP